MPHIDPSLTTGLPGLDRLLTGLIPGDNIVWQVASADDYVPFVTPYCESALLSGQGIVYFRFADHPPLASSGPGVSVYELRPEEGFEAFLSDIHRAIEDAGHGGYYLFDMLSSLAVDWYSDQMLGNFFMLTCPYLYDVGAIAYFGLLQGYHSSEAVDAIFTTAQVNLDVYQHKGKTYLHPNKVQQRYSPTMHMLHVRDGDDFRPVSHSATISEVMTASHWPGFGGAGPSQGVVNRAFASAEAYLHLPLDQQDAVPEGKALMRQLIKTCFSRDQRISELLEKYLTLTDVVEVRRRMIGTGLIGGKSVGMLLARTILRERAPRLNALLEPHDSFYVGSDVYYSFVVHNGLWWMRERQPDTDAYLDRAKRARQRMLIGSFPDHVVAKLAAMMDYFGQSPIIIRSSSLLEDAFGNAFAGKYESVFCPNQGPRHKRLDDILTAVRTIYASSMSENALTYRAERGLLDRDEQMALLVQRVSGVKYGDLFFPQVAGVGLSFNPFVWSDHIDPESGVLRLVFGLGTRAVDRYDDDYTRVVALNAPERRPESAMDEVRRYSQRRVDVIDLAANQLLSSDFVSVAKRGHGIPLQMFASQDIALEREMHEQGRRDIFSWMLTFERLLKETDFPRVLRDMLSTLQDAYGSPVDVEFAANFTEDESYRINLVQCRPLQVEENAHKTVAPEIEREGQDIVLMARSAVIGHSRVLTVDRVVYVAPSVYAELLTQQRHAVARLIGRLTHRGEGEKNGHTMLIGPGRWGSSTPALGVPVTFREISTVDILLEVVAMRDDLVPDVSLGTHFFSDIVERNILYVALFPDREGNTLRSDYFETASPLPPHLAPTDPAVANAVRLHCLTEPEELTFIADSTGQRAICYRSR
jgi:pyruvate, water dikinase